MEVTKMKIDRKMLNIGLLISLPIMISTIIFGSILIGDGTNVDIIQQDKEIGTWRYKGQIENQSKIIYNSIWGATDDEKKNQSLKQYIYYKYNDNFGWEWDRPDPRPSSGAYVQPVFPQVMIGPRNEEYSSTSYIPIRLGDISSIVGDIGYEYVKYPTGEYNLAYDIWITEDLKVRSEVMIWITGNEGDKPTDEVSDRYNTYIYYYRPSSGDGSWDYHAFIIKDQNPYKRSGPLNHTVDIKILIDYLKQKGKLKDEWDLYRIHFGNEIWRGAGRIEINKYVISLNGTNI